MDDRYARLESAIEGLRCNVAFLDQRVQALEAGRALAASSIGETNGEGAALAAQAPRGDARSPRNPYDPIVLLSLTGRLLLVLAGGFFLRAMTEAGLLVPPLGIGLAFLYALLWLLLADRSGRNGYSPSMLFHAVGSALVAFPLLVEATTRFEVIGVGGSAIGLVLLTAGFLFVALRRRLHAVAWIVVVAALPTSVVLLLKTGAAAPFALYLVALGVTTLWLTYAYGWRGLRWPTALAADLAVVALTLRALSPDQSGAVSAAVLLQLVLVGTYLGSVAVQTLLRDRNVTLFEVTQTFLALFVGFGGAIFLTRSTAMVPALIGTASLLVGTGCYALAFRFVGRHEGHERNVQFYAALALMLILAGLALALTVQSLGAASAALAVLAVAGWRRYGRLYLLLHGVAYLAAAGLALHAFAYSVWALFASPERWVAPTWAIETTVVAAAVATWIAAQRGHPEGGVPANASRLVLAGALFLTAAGLVTGLLAGLLASSADGTVNLGALATVRTGVLSATALLVAWGARQERFREWVWLVYPLLVLVGLKMVAQDFKLSRPATLFIALALYGIALIVAPRLRRQRARRRVAADDRSASADEPRVINTAGTSVG